MKPAYDLIGAIIAIAIRLKLISPDNYKQYIQLIKVEQDLRGEAREAVELWASPGKQASYSGSTPMGVFMNPGIRFTEKDIPDLKQLLENYDFKAYIRALEVFSLAPSVHHTNLFKSALLGMRGRSIEQCRDINLPLILANTRRYLLNPQNYRLFGEQGQLRQLMDTLLAHHHEYFKEYSIEYHLDVMAQLGAAGIYHREYEGAALSRLLSWRVSLPLLKHCINTLALNDRSFPLEEVSRMIKVIKDSYLNWTDTLILLEQEVGSIVTNILKRQTKVSTSPLHVCS